MKIENSVRYTVLDYNTSWLAAHRVHFCTDLTKQWMIFFKLGIPIVFEYAINETYKKQG